MDFNYTDFMANQAELRTRLFKHIVENEMSMATAAREIGITQPTLFSFLRDKKDLDLVPLARIFNFLRKSEKPEIEKLD